MLRIERSEHRSRLEMDSESEEYKENMMNQLINLLIFLRSVDMPTETLYWVFSSLVQALLALVALTGVASIFKLQTLSAREDRILKISPANPHKILKDQAYFPGQYLLDTINKYLANATAGEDTKDLRVMKANLEEIFQAKKTTIKNAIVFTIYTLCLVFLALFFLIFSTQITALKLGIFAVSLIFIITAYSLFLAAKSFIKAFK